MRTTRSNADKDEDLTSHDERQPSIGLVLHGHTSRDHPVKNLRADKWMGARTTVRTSPNTDEAPKIVLSITMHPSLLETPENHLCRLGEIADEQPHVLVEQPAAVADIDGRLLLVARQHPDLDAGARQSVDRLRHLALLEE